MVGTGYIGSHAVVEALNAGMNVVVFDNLSNSSVVPLHRIAEITGKKYFNWKVFLRIQRRRPTRVFQGRYSK